MIPAHSSVIRKFCMKLLDDIFGEGNREYGVIELPYNIDIQVLKQVLGCLYGFDLKLNRRDILIFLRTITYLRVKLLVKAVEEDMLENFKEYQLFLMLDAAVSLEFPVVENECRKRLKDQRFQQMRISRHYLNKCSEQVFLCVIQYHNEAKLDGLPVQEDWFINYVIGDYAFEKRYSASQKKALFYKAMNLQRKRTRVLSKQENKYFQETARVKRSETEQMITEGSKQPRELFRSPYTEPNNAKLAFQKAQEKVNKIKMDELDIQIKKRIEAIVGSLNKNADREGQNQKQFMKRCADMTRNLESIMQQSKNSQDKLMDLQRRVKLQDDKQSQKTSIRVQSPSSSSSSLYKSCKNGELLKQPMLKKFNQILEEQELNESASYEQKQRKQKQAHQNFGKQNIQVVTSDMHYEPT